MGGITRETENPVGQGLPGSTIRYSAPELIEDKDASPTTHSDTYSFAMLVFECITEDVPFSDLSRDAAVIHAKIHKRLRPPRPKDHVSKDLWDLMMLCWSDQPDQRPTMERVHEFFRGQLEGGGGKGGYNAIA